MTLPVGAGGVAGERRGGACATASTNKQTKGEVSPGKGGRLPPLATKKALPRQAGGRAGGQAGEAAGRRVPTGVAVQVPGVVQAQQVAKHVQAHAPACALRASRRASTA